MSVIAPPVASVATATIDRLKSAVGPAGFLDDPADIAPHCVSWRDDWQGSSPLVLRPVTTAEVAAVVRICAGTRTPIVPQGGNTGVTGAGQPHAGNTEVILSTSRMKKFREVDLANDTITVEAGVVLAEIQRKAAEYDRLFPLSLGAEGSCQIGGNISTNAGGNQVLRYGNTRSLVLGLEVVLADGQIWDGLRGLRKDNAGYDLKQLFIGAEGTLGIVTAAVLRLFPRPTAVETAWLGVPGPAEAVTLLGHMKQAMGDQISSFELISRQTLEFLLQGVPGHEDPLPAVHPWYVLMEVGGQGAPGALAEPFAEALGSAMGHGLIVDAIISTSGAQSSRFWKMRENFAQAQQAAGGVASHDVSVPVSRIPEFLRRTDAELRKAYPEIRLNAFGHVGDGNMHYNPAKPLVWDAARFKSEKPAINRIVHDIVVALGGSISAEHGLGRMRRDENERYKSPVELALMRAVKQMLDPHNIMNPGKVLNI